MYKVLSLPNLPQVPEHLLKYTREMQEDCMNHTDQSRNLTYLGDRILTKHGKTFNEGMQRKARVNEDLEPWIKENIIADYKDIGYWHGMGPCLGPHLDRSRFFLLIYVLEPGGTDVATVFYKARTENVAIDYDGTRVNDYDQLEIDEVFYLKPKQWYLFSGKSGLHSVENITGMRISLQIGLMRDPIDRVRLI